MSRSPFFPAAAWRPCSGDIAMAYIEGIVVYSSESAARHYIPAAVPSGAAQEAGHATQQARSEIFKLSLGTSVGAAPLGSTSPSSSS